MTKNEWLKMLIYQQELHHFARTLLAQKKEQTLTVSELEILTVLYSDAEKSTPLALTHETGMKKEAVSRCLKQLFDKGCIQKEQHPVDKRSYNLSLTETGVRELNDNYSLILKMMIELKAQMGQDFDDLFTRIEDANQYMINITKK